MPSRYAEFGKVDQPFASAGPGSWYVSNGGWWVTMSILVCLCNGGIISFFVSPYGSPCCLFREKLKNDVFAVQLNGWRGAPTML